MQVDRVKRVLLVDDEPSVRDVLKFVLGLEEYTVVTAASGYEALAAFGEGPFDLVVTDYVMPGMLGDELAHRIKSLVPEQPILMITAHPDRVSRSGAVIDAVLTKPFEIDTLRGVVARLIGNGKPKAGQPGVQPRER